MRRFQTDTRAWVDRRRNVLIVLGGAAAVWLVVWLLGLRGPRTPEETVQEALVAFERRDADAIYDLMSDEEKEATGTDLDSFRKFFNEYVVAKLHGFERSGEPKLQQVGAAGNDVSSNQALVHNDGRKIGIGFSARPAGNEDAKLRGVVVTLFMPCMISEFPPGPLPSGGVLATWASVIERDVEKLKATGITEVWMMNDGAGDQGPRSWEDWARGLRRTSRENSRASSSG